MEAQPKEAMEVGSMKKSRKQRRKAAAKVKRGQEQRSTERLLDRIAGRQRPGVVQISLDAWAPDTKGLNSQLAAGLNKLGAGRVRRMPTGGGK
jgi:hypothetical protein